MKAIESPFDLLGQSYVEHASPEAIRADLDRLQRQREQITKHMQELIRLGHERQAQIQEGVWPGVVRLR